MTEHGRKKEEVARRGIGKHKENCEIKRKKI
jgi:hypothetical protein